MQQQHLMQMNQNMIGGYTSPAAVTTDLIQQVLILTQIPPSLPAPAISSCL